MFLSNQNQGSRASWVTVSGRSSPVLAHSRPVMRRRASLASCPEVEYVSKAFYECEAITWHYFRWHLIGSNVTGLYLNQSDADIRSLEHAWYRWWFPSKPIFEILGISLLMCPNCTFTSHDDAIMTLSAKLYRCKGRLTLNWDETILNSWPFMIKRFHFRHIPLNFNLST